MHIEEKTAEAINTLGCFCGKRDVEELTPAALKRAFGIEQADVMVLFGGSILAGGDVLACAMEEKIARRYVIVGGRGHTTETLCRQMEREIPGLRTDGLSEAELFQAYLKEKYGREADWLETESTNCGNNITYLLELLKAKKFAWKSIILCQDATMQLRMEAGLRKYMPEDVLPVSYAAYRAEVALRDGRLTYTDDIHGMWEMERYVQLLMGEIPRLTDDAYGYGPAGKDFIAHVDISEEVREAFEELKEVYGDTVREANPLYASK